jgi:branched-chain amino acid transport system ATP-binding protein
MLKVDNIHVYYGAIHAVKGLSFHVERGELVTLLGANGAGKTTTLKTLSGLLQPTRGSVELDGTPLETLEAHEIVRRGVAHVPEGRKVFPRFTVLENLKIGAYVRSNGDLESSLDLVFQKFPRLKVRQKQYAGTLSGGEQQMLAISRALMLSPKLLVLDEPSFGLAPLVTQEIFRIMRSINQEQRLSVLIVEQNATLALEFADHACVLETGRVVATGTPDLLRGDESIRRAYLGY